MKMLVRNGANGANIPKGFAAAMKLCQQVGAGTFTLVVPSKGDLARGEVGKFLKEPTAKRLVAGQTVKVNGNLTMNCESPATIRKTGHAKVLLVFHVDRETMRMVDGLTGVAGIVYVPWVEEDGNDWQRTWNAAIAGEKVEQHEPNLDARVTAALEGLTGSVNLATGLGHPSDKEHAKRVFKQLRADGVNFVPSEIEIWAVRHNWRPDHAAELKKMAEKFAG